MCERDVGGSKRRLWRKIHIGIDEETLEIRAIEVTSSSIGPSRDHVAHEPAGQWIHCVKLLGQRLSARDFDRQVAEIQIRAVILNGFTTLGIPRTVAVA